MRSKEILFVHPPSPMLEIQRMVPPLGQLQLAAVLRDGGHESGLLDVGEDPVDIEQLLETRYLLFTATTPQYPEALKIAKQVMKEKRRRRLKNPILALGGVHASYMQEKLIPDGWNHICVGEGEKIIIPLVEGKINEGVVKGIQTQNLDELPYPLYDFLDPSIYRRSDEHNTTYPTMTARGCPYNCIFCGYHGCQFIGRKVRYHSSEYVIGVEKEIKRTNVDQVVRYDDTFTLKTGRVIDICKGLEPLGITWRCNAHVNTIVKQRGLENRLVSETGMLLAMRDSGCRLISLGVDGADQDALDYLKKGTSIDRCEAAIDEVKKAGIMVKVFLIYIPGGGMRYVETMKYFLKRTDPEIAQLSVLTPLPGSDIYEHPESYGLNFDKTRLDNLFYQSREGEFNDTGLLKKEDYFALDNFTEFLREWQRDKPPMPI